MGRTQIFNDTQCREAAEAVSGVLYLAPSLCNTVSSVATFFVCGLIYLNYKFRLFYHINARILIFLNIGSYLIFSTATLLNYSILFINAIFADNNCDYLFLTKNCSILRRCFLFSNMLSTLSSFSIILERAYATWKLGLYEHYGPRLGFFLATGCIMISAMMVAIVTGEEDATEMMTNCYAFSSSPSVGHRVYNMFRFEFAVDIATWIGYFFLLWFHEHRIRQQIKGKLPQRFQAEENKLVLQVLRPTILTSSAIIAVYIIFSSTGHLFRDQMSLAHYKQLASMIFIMPHNSLISITLYYFIFKWGCENKKKRMEDTVSSPNLSEKEYMAKLSREWQEEFDKRESANPSPRTPRATSYFNRLSRYTSTV
ncbi:CRE-SRA-37 protein [Caenorhabditis remanei]|uniref:CRE-SRA-37 protein n=1 Tax=Caenorhabditis remanei TaxID=31234 RepID=E3ME47_CAERE|nr:CRE-SRA-37 protein [Caenorhabditis remanei]